LKGGAVAGAASDAIAVASGKEVEAGPEFEERPLFDDVLLGGKLGLYPKPTGWVRANVGGLALTGFKGQAAKAGLTIEEGLFDAAVSLRFPGDGSVAAQTKLQLTDLDVSEPDDGPVFRYLELPAPLGAVIFALRDSEGTITVPLNVAVDPNNVSMTALAAAAVATLGKLVAQAIAQVPLRVGSSVAGLVAGEEEAPEEGLEAPIILEFAPADAMLAAGEAAKLGLLLERRQSGEKLVIGLEHGFGAADLARAGQRANPPPEQCLEIAARLRREKKAMFRQREELAAHCRTAVLSGLWAEAGRLRQRLSRLDRQITEADEALEDFLARVRPGAERLAPRRAREANLTIARARLAAVRSVLLAGAPGEAADAVRVTRPAAVESAPEGAGKVVVTIKTLKR
jgi:hypothetical protein